MVEQVSAAQQTVNKMARSFSVLTGESVTGSLNSRAPSVGGVSITFRFETAQGRDKAASMHATFGMPAADICKSNDAMGVHIARWIIAV